MRPADCTRLRVRRAALLVRVAGGRLGGLPDGQQHQPQPGQPEHHLADGVLGQVVDGAARAGAGLCPGQLQRDEREQQVHGAVRDQADPHADVERLAVADLGGRVRYRWGVGHVATVTGRRPERMRNNDIRANTPSPCCPGSPTWTACSSTRNGRSPAPRSSSPGCGRPGCASWCSPTTRSTHRATCGPGCSAAAWTCPRTAIWTSALATAQFLDDQRPGGSAYTIGEAGLTTALHEVGYVLTDPRSRLRGARRDPDLLVRGHHHRHPADRGRRPLHRHQPGRDRAVAARGRCRPAARWRR